MEDEYKKSMAEAVDVINNSGKEIINKIPKKVYNFLKNNMDKDYIVNIDYSQKDWNKQLRNYTNEILAILYIYYITSNDERKRIIEEKYEEEVLRQKNLKEKYNTDNMFKKPGQTENDDTYKNNLPVIAKKESLFKRLINRIKAIFRHKL